MSRLPNTPKTGGRKAGTRNHITSGIKAALIEVFRRLGGIDGFAKWAKENESEFYKIWAKMLPAEVALDPDANKIIVEIVQFTQAAE